MYFLTFLSKNLLRRKIRSTLTFVGVAIAVGTTVSFLGVADGFKRSTLEAFERRGYDIIVVEKSVLNQLDSDIPEALAREVAEFPEVRRVAMSLIELVGFDVKGSTVPVVIQGWEPGSFLFDELEVLSGRKFDPGEKRVAMLGQTMAEHLEKQAGDTIEVDGEPFEVIGVFRSFTGFENISMLVPLAALQEVSFREDRLTGFAVVLEAGAKDEQQVRAVATRIEALQLPEGQPGRLSAQPIFEHIRDAMHLRTAESMAWLTSMIAVVVGTIGILNTMIMSVTERVREISILRAIGWRKSRVVQMILGESLMISLIGACLGTLAAIALTRWLTTLPAARDVVTPRIAPGIILQGFGLALLVGVLGGFYPALRAARLLPSEGLRHE